MRIKVEGHEFCLELGTLRRESRYVNSMFNADGRFGRYQEVRDRTLDLDDFQAYHFALFAEYIKHAEFDLDDAKATRYITGSGNATSRPMITVPIGNESRIVDRLITSDIDHLVECWILGDYLRARNFQNYVMNRYLDALEQIYNATNGGVPLHNLSHIESNTREYSPLIKVTEDCVRLCLGRNVFDLAKHKHYIPREFKVRQVADDNTRAGASFNGPNRISNAWNTRVNYHYYPNFNFNGHNEEYLYWEEVPGTTGPWNNYIDPATHQAQGMW